ncbi:MAG: (2Fe-2S) ferredoxin domain-containing protein [Clostridiales bacterium]|nr:(2Fe-2S) ferredoxin domain-containing protein [Clostridiales bacterium]
MNLSVCIGSSCHLKGSKQVARTFQTLIEEKGLTDKVEFCASFCMGNCQNGVSVSLDGTVHSVSPETAEAFFQNEVLTRIEK